MTSNIISSIYISRILKGEIKMAKSRYDEIGPQEDWEELNKISQRKDEYEYGPKPNVCKKCGGPWPDCETSCSLFDD